MARKAKEKSNREKKNPYAHEAWTKRKQTRNAKYRQTWHIDIKAWLQQANA